MVHAWTQPLENTLAMLGEFFELKKKTKNPTSITISILQSNRSSSWFLENIFTKISAINCAVKWHMIEKRKIHGVARHELKRA